MGENNIDKKGIVRISASIDVGLNDGEVAKRKEEGLSNIPSKKVEKSFLRILFENTFTPFNIALFSIGAVFLFFIIYLCATGKNEIANKDFGISKFGFLIPAIINSLIGSIQELHGKRVLSKLKLLNQSKASVIRNGAKIALESNEIVLDDILSLSSGEQCLADCVLLKGELSVDEGMLTGESDPISKKEGDLIYAGSSILSGQGFARVEKVGDDTFAENMSSKVNELPRHKSELMTNINKIIKFLAYAILVVIAVIAITLCIKIHIHNGDPKIFEPDIEGAIPLSLGSVETWGKIILTQGAFAVGMIPEGLVLLTSIALMVSIIKLAKQKTLIQELYSLENLSRVDVICLDKTGTLTSGNMKVVDSLFFGDQNESIDHLKDILGAFGERNQTSKALIDEYGIRINDSITSKEPFSSDKKHSSITYENGDTIKLGAPEYIIERGDNKTKFIDEKTKEGNRVIALVKNDRLIALFALEDEIRKSAKETLMFFGENNVEVKIISGDNLQTVTKISENCGVKGAEKGISLENVNIEKIPDLVEDYTIFARVSPEQKLALVEALQNKGHKVAMTGDGVNDILALRKANASITFASATDAAKSCSDVVLLDNDFSHLKEVVSQGRRVVNNIERSAILFLMKTTAIFCLAICLIPFSRGQMWYSIENIYLMQTAVIGVGGFLFSLEPQKEPIKGSFKSNVFPRAVLSGIFILLAALLPLILNRAPLSFGGESIVSDGNAKTLISFMTAVAGIVCALSMSYPITKYRAFCLASIIGVALLLIFALPTSYMGGRATTFSMFVANDGNIFHSPFFHVFFQPWNSSVFTEFAEDYKNFIVIGAFVLIASPLHFILMRKADKKRKQIN